MNFNIYEFVLGLKLCKVRLDDEHFLNYKENEYFIKALEIIGKAYGKSFYGSECKYSDYRLGVMYVKECTNNIYKTHVSYSQVKRLARPNCKRVHAMKFPTKTFEILSTVRSLIDNSNTCCSDCKELKRTRCHALKQRNILCRDFLVGNFYECLKYKREEYISGTYSATLLQLLERDLTNCNT